MAKTPASTTTDSQQNQNNKWNTSNSVQRLVRAPPTATALTWLGPCAPWHTYRTTRRIYQPRHVPSLPNEAAWTARLNEYLDRDDETGCSAHIPPRVYNTVVDTALTPSRTQFTRYGWVRTFGEMRVRVKIRGSMPMRFGWPPGNGARLDARQALIRGTAVYNDDGAGLRQMDATQDDATVESVDDTSAAMVVGDYADNDYDELLHPMDPDEASSEVDEVAPILYHPRWVPSQQARYLRNGLNVPTTMCFEPVSRADTIINTVRADHVHSFHPIGAIVF